MAGGELKFWEGNPASGGLRRSVFNIPNGPGKNGTLMLFVVGCLKTHPIPFCILLVVLLAPGRGRWDMDCSAVICPGLKEGVKTTSKEDGVHLGGRVAAAAREHSAHSWAHAGLSPAHVSL